MKIGDRVRFLDSIGGGKVTGFQGRDIVLVEDEDGFDVPVLIRNCVVVDADQEKRMSGETPMQAPPVKKAQPAPNHKSEPADRPVTFKAPAEERKGGDRLSIYLCFEPIEVKDLKKTEFDIYLVNDSNYCISYTFLSGSNTIWMLRHIDTAEPNTKVYIETIATEDLNEIQNICLQFMAFKEEKTFMLKAPVSAEIRLDLTRFYKLHLFRPNDFFETPVLTVPIMESDALVCDPRKALLDQMQQAKEASAKDTAASRQPAKNPKDDEIVDLHASELLDTTAGMTPNDILEYQLDTFKKKMAEFSRIKGKRIVFIHGKGEGVLRSRIITELKRTYPRCNWQDASFREYGFGATLVIIH